MNIFHEVWLARHRITPLLRPTPLLYSVVLSRCTRGAVRLKPECLQETGSFKIRGTANKILSLQNKPRGIVTCSSGNHGKATAFVAQQLGIPATIVVSRYTARNKIEAICSFGASILDGADDYDEAEKEAKRLGQAERFAFIHPFDDLGVIAGQGTIGLEMLQEWPELDAVVVPLSGGGLISGIGIALKTISPHIQIIGVSQERAPVMYHSLRVGKPITLPYEPTLADALGGGIDLENRYTFSFVQQYVDAIYLVTEEEIKQAICFLLTEHHLIVEGGGAVGVAALLAQKIPLAGRRTGVVLSGGNIDLAVLQQIVTSCV